MRHVSNSIVKHVSSHRVELAGLGSSGRRQTIAERLRIGSETAKAFERSMICKLLAVAEVVLHDR